MVRMNPATDLRYRLYVAGVIVDEAWVDTSHPESVVHAVQASERQAARAIRATTEGELWIEEIYDPALPEEEAYIRWGTDEAATTAPFGPLPIEDTLELAKIQFRRSHGVQ